MDTLHRAALYGLAFRRASQIGSSLGKRGEMSKDPSRDYKGAVLSSAPDIDSTAFVAILRPLSVALLVQKIENPGTTRRALRA
jgi:hypothetical protein